MHQYSWYYLYIITFVCITFGFFFYIVIDTCDPFGNLVRYQFERKRKEKKMSLLIFGQFLTMSTTHFIPCLGAHGGGRRLLVIAAKFVFLKKGKKKRWTIFRECFEGKKYKTQTARFWFRWVYWFTSALTKV